jgi:hypothetical protein
MVSPDPVIPLSRSQSGMTMQVFLGPSTTNWIYIDGEENLEGRAGITATRMCMAWSDHDAFSFLFRDTFSLQLADTRISMSGCRLGDGPI